MNGFFFHSKRTIGLVPLLQNHGQTGCQQTDQNHRVPVEFHRIRGITGLPILQVCTRDYTIFEILLLLLLPMNISADLPLHISSFWALYS